MSFQKSIVFLTNMYLKNLKIALVYVLFVKIFYQGKILRFQNVIMRCDVTPVIFAYKTKLNILQRKQVTKILQKKLLSHFISDLYNAIINIWGEISCHRHFKRK